jgi:hypothetical protein
MMGEGAFHPLKAGRKQPESSKQAEMALAWVSKILSIHRLGAGRGPGQRTADFPRLRPPHPFGLNCLQFPQDMANWGDFAVLLFSSQY